MRRFLIILLNLFLFHSLHGHQSHPGYILVVGGGGFIGSHVNERLHENGYRTIVLDNLSTGNRQAILHGLFIKGDLADEALLDQTFRDYPIDAVMHFAAFKDVGESVSDPLKYYFNNVSYTLNLLQAMLRHGVNKFVFSSSAAIFGLPPIDEVAEDDRPEPINPYGRTKLVVENILRDLDAAYGLRFCALRYFNAAGGDPQGKIKDYQKKAGNLIPIVLRSLQEENGAVKIFGTDYPTPDGTAIRDYIHIEDLSAAHIAALERLLNGAPSGCYNLGNGKGFSVREVIAAAERVTGRKVNTIEGDRRKGDPAILIANSAKAKRELNWEPIYPSIDEMVLHAWQAMQP
ncbi:UDP-glucose 4-epimerase GalE [Candidatus Protochlamydia phocaeensis]|uniref:UDP-glucose 4-epimerase GalE n=1 Tax=Candidatus Protochlamydia phocaeensis TaxID=1414722 RepID=UPI00083939E0|nr:UDP-glucose 4-epimerase GalE [Candidatus Protochlamydia phocaeensis]